MKIEKLNAIQLSYIKSSLYIRLYELEYLLDMDPDDRLWNGQSLQEEPAAIRGILKIMKETI